MRIKLIRPKAEAAFNHLSFYPLPKGKTFFAAPVSLAVIASLTPEGVDVKIADEYTEELNLEEPADIVGISIVNSFMASRAYKIASAYRQKGVTVIFGGLHTSLFPKECLEYSDAIVVGEAEDIWTRVIADFRKHMLKRVYRCKKRPSLENRPMPRWDLVDCGAYDMITVNASRGCPHHCEFCIAKIHMGTELRHRPVEDVVKEVAYLKHNFRPSKIWFVDYNFTADRRYAKRLMRALIPLKIKYHCFTNVDIYKDKELLELLAMSGCFSVSVGIESLDYETIADINKKETNDVSKYETAIGEIRRYGLDVVCNFIVGNEHDNEKTFEDLKKFIAKNDIVLPYIFPAGVFPCSEWHRNLKTSDDTRCSQFKASRYSDLKSEWMGSPEFWFYYTKMFYEVYSYEAIFKRQLHYTMIRKKGYKEFKTLFHLLKRIPKAAKAGILTGSLWGMGTALFSDYTLPFAAWQRITCLKNFLIAYSNSKVDNYSKEPEKSLRDDVLLKTVEKLIKKQEGNKLS